MTPLELSTLVTAILGVPLVAGALGGVVRWIVLVESRKQGPGSLFIGMLTGHYFDQVAGQWLGNFADFSQIAPEAIRGTGAFVVGVGGIWVIQWLMDVLRKRTEIRKES